MERVRAPALALLMVGVLSQGCVRRTITITSDPPGALVWLNDREIGRTPVDVDFEYYGTYDVQLRQPGYEPLMTSGNAAAPWWETVGLDLVAELAPLNLHSRVQWHYALEPQHMDAEALTERARQLRSRVTDDQPGQSNPRP